MALGVGMTVLLYFKAELEGFSQKLTAQDIRSMLQFAVLTAVILPLLPDRSFGPYGVLNPFQVWLMVVLVAAVSLAGYVAWRLTLGRHGLLLTGVLGGLVSSTATTLVYARHVAAAPNPGCGAAGNTARERHDAGARHSCSSAWSRRRPWAGRCWSLCRRCSLRWGKWPGAGGTLPLRRRPTRPPSAIRRSCKTALGFAAIYARGSAAGGLGQ